MSKMTKTIAALGVVAGLGVAALPLSSYAAEVTNTGATSANADVTFSATVGNSISITAADDTVAVTDVIANQEVKEGSTTVKIATNNATGYQLQIKDKDSDLALKPASTGTTEGIAAGVPTKGTNAWGFKASATDTDITLADNGYRAIKATNQVVAEKSSASAAGGDIVTLTFGVTVDSTILPDTYSDIVTLTASSQS